MNNTQETLEPGVHSNRDPITGEPGSHPVGTGLGSAGGAAGHAAGEALDPTVEIAYWRAAYVTRPYYRRDRKFEELEPAYRYGLERATALKAGQRFEEVESELERTWPTARGNNPNAWQEVRDAARASWIRVRGQ